DLQALPALVAVHRVVAADRAGQAADADLLQLGGDVAQVAGGRLRRRVAPVEERVPHDAVEAAALGRLTHGVGVFQRGVDVARAGQPHEVQRPARALGGVDRLADDRVRVESAVLDAEVDADDVLVDDAPGAQVQVADLAVAHLSVGQADVVAGGAD